MILPPNAPTAPDTERERERRRSEHRALGFLALAALAVIAWVSRPIGVGMFIGALTAFILQPLYAWLCIKVRHPRIAQVICVFLTGVVVLAVIVGTITVLVARGTVLGLRLLETLQPGGELRAYVEALRHKLALFGLFGTTHFIDQLRDAASRVATYVGGIATALAGETFHVMLALFFVLLTTSFVLANGAEVESAVENLSPLSLNHTRALLAQIRYVGRATLLGSVVTGLTQGLLAGLVYLACGVPEAVFFGVATAVASLFPGVGTLLVWVPAGAYLIATGHVARGVIELVASAVFVVGFCDYLLRPMLVGGEKMPALLTFAALFGGLEAFGLVGLLLGPLLMSVAVAVLRLYREDVLEDARLNDSAQATSEPPAV